MIKVALYPVLCAWCSTDIPDATSEVQGSHGICQPCIDTHFPELGIVLSQDTPEVTGTAKGTTNHEGKT